MAFKQKPFYKQYVKVYISLSDTVRLAAVLSKTHRKKNLNLYSDVHHRLQHYQCSMVHVTSLPLQPASGPLLTAM